MAAAPTDIVACADCDLLQRVPPAASGETWRCGRCGRMLAAHTPHAAERTLALSAAALVVFLLANAEPLMVLSAAGRETSTTILGGTRAMWLQGERAAAVLVALFAVIMPALEICFVMAVAVASRAVPSPRWVGTLLRWARISGLWSMMEVMLLGILVSLVKIASLATVSPGVGIFAVGALVFLLALISVSFDPQAIWPRVRWATAGPADGDASVPGTGAPEAGK